MIALDRAGKAARRCSLCRQPPRPPLCGLKRTRLDRYRMTAFGEVLLQIKSLPSTCSKDAQGRIPKAKGSEEAWRRKESPRNLTRLHVPTSLRPHRASPNRLRSTKARLVHRLSPCDPTSMHILQTNREAAKQRAERTPPWTFFGLCWKLGYRMSRKLATRTTYNPLLQVSRHHRNMNILDVTDPCLFIRKSRIPQRSRIQVGNAELDVAQSALGQIGASNRRYG